MLNFLKKFYHGEIIVNARGVLPGGQELDFWFPEENIAIEFNGTFFHSSNRRKAMKPDYHLKKTEACEKIGIRLVHIFEDQWKSNKEVLKSILRAVFGSYDMEIGAKDCIVRKARKENNQRFFQEKQTWWHSTR